MREKNKQTNREHEILDRKKMYGNIYPELDPKIAAYLTLEEIHLI